MLIFATAVLNFIKKTCEHGDTAKAKFPFKRSAENS